MLETLGPGAPARVMGANCVDRCGNQKHLGSPAADPADKHVRGSPATPSPTPISRVGKSLQRVLSRPGVDGFRHGYDKVDPTNSAFPARQRLPGGVHLGVKRAPAAPDYSHVRRSFGQG